MRSEDICVGCGVAGLEVLGKSRALGSDVRAWDVRDVFDEVASMGAKVGDGFYKGRCAGQGGYAKESSAKSRRSSKSLS